MKQGKALITFVMVLLAAALTCYLGYYVWDTLQGALHHYIHL